MDQEIEVYKNTHNIFRQTFLKYLFTYDTYRNKGLFINIFTLWNNYSNTMTISINNSTLIEKECESESLI